VLKPRVRARHRRGKWLTAFTYCRTFCETVERQAGRFEAPISDPLVEDRDDQATPAPLARVAEVVQRRCRSCPPRRNTAWPVSALPLLDCVSGGDSKMKRRHLRQTARVVSCTTLVITCLTFGLAAVHADANPIVIRYLNDTGFVPSFEIANALGFLKATDIRIQPEGDSPGGPKSLAALASGSVDVVGVATPAVINAIAAGARILCIMPRAGISSTANSKFFVLNSSPIKAANDLKGKSIEVNILGAHLDYTAREYLRKHGLNTSDVTLVAVSGSRLDETLRQRQAEVVAVGAWQSPIAARIAAEGGVRVLFTDHDVLGDIVLANNVMETAFVAQHSQVVREFVTASAKAVDWTVVHPDEARKLVAQILQQRGDSPATVAAAADWPGYGLSQHALYDDHDIEFWLNVLVREGKLKPGQFQPQDIATNKYNANAHLAQ
jgi:ABC-type nitrate/sulfonate/bicarbonate transport system substrate-binding protein